MKHIPTLLALTLLAGCAREIAVATPPDVAPADVTPPASEVTKWPTPPDQTFEGVPVYGEFSDEELESILAAISRHASRERLPNLVCIRSDPSPRWPVEVVLADNEDCSKHRETLYLARESEGWIVDRILTSIH